MSWHITFNDLEQYEDTGALRYLDATQVEYIASRHTEYLGDLELAFRTAKTLGLKSCSLSGFRTASPYNDDEVVDVSVRGLTVHRDFNVEMKRMIGAGPDEPEEQ